jgi:hypothetical protein
MAAFRIGRLAVDRPNVVVKVQWLTAPTAQIVFWHPNQDTKASPKKWPIPRSLRHPCETCSDRGLLCNACVALRAAGETGGVT